MSDIDFECLLQGEVPGNIEIPAMPKIYSKGTVCIITEDEETVPAALQEDVFQGQEAVTAQIFKFEHNALTATSQCSKTVLCRLLGQTLQLETFSKDEIYITERQFETIFHEGACRMSMVKIVLRSMKN